MKRKKKPRRKARPLKTTLADLTGPVRLPTKQPAIPLPKSPTMPRPPRSAREVLALLTAATGLVLAGRSDAEVELLPGTPTTILITSAGQAQAAFVLPVPHEEACRALGRPAAPVPDPELDVSFRQACVESSPTTGSIIAGPPARRTADARHNPGASDRPARGGTTTVQELAQAPPP